MSKRKPTNQTAYHSSKTARWGTPSDVVEFARMVLGRIDCDPASSATHNLVVKAGHFLDGKEGRDGLKDSWRPPGSKGPYTVFLNPPGSRDGLRVKKFWKRLVRKWKKGEVEAAFYVGFSLEQLVQLQNGGGLHPLSDVFSIVVPNKRVCYLKKGVPQKQPGHGSFFVLLPPRHPASSANMLHKFRKGAAAHGWALVPAREVA